MRRKSRASRLRWSSSSASLWDLVQVANCWPIIDSANAFLPFLFYFSLTLSFLRFHAASLYDSTTQLAQLRVGFCIFGCREIKRAALWFWSNSDDPIGSKVLTLRGVSILYTTAKKQMTNGCRE